VGLWSYPVPQAMQRHTGHRFAKPSILSTVAPKLPEDEPVSAAPPVKKPQDPKDKAAPAQD